MKKYIFYTTDGFTQDASLKETENCQLLGIGLGNNIEQAFDDFLNENDYIHFNLRKADGSYLSVLDHGRIVNSQQYGRVFYVLFTDWEDMHIHYGDKFSE